MLALTRCHSPRRQGRQARPDEADRQLPERQQGKSQGRSQGQPDLPGAHHAAEEGAAGERAAEDREFQRFRRKGPAAASEEPASASSEDPASAASEDGHWAFGVQVAPVKQGERWGWWRVEVHAFQERALVWLGPRSFWLAQIPTSHDDDEKGPRNFGTDTASLRAMGRKTKTLGFQRHRGFHARTGPLSHNVRQ